MKQCLIFLDTSVLLHSQFFTELDWRKLVTTDRVTVVLCTQVIHELDEKKFSGSPRDRDRAGKVIKRVEQLSRDGTDPEFREGCFLRLLHQEPRIELEAHGLSSRVGDDLIIAAALEQMSATTNVFIVANDFGLRLKARARGFVAPDLPEGWQRPEEPDEQQRSLRSALQELNLLKLAAPALSLTLDGESTLTVTLKRRQPLSRQDIDRRLDELRKKFPPEDLTPATFGPALDFTREMGAPSRVERRNYNEALKLFLKESEDYLIRHVEVFDRQDRTVCVPFTLENTGGKTGEDIDVIVEVSEGGAWRVAQPPIAPAPKPPRRPQPRGYDLALAPVYPSSMKGLDHLMEGLKRVRDNVEGPSVDLTNDRVVTFNVQQVKTGLPIQLPDIFFEFSSFDAPRGVTIRYRLVARNMSAPHDDELHLKVDGGL